MNKSFQAQAKTWNDRLQALKNLPPVLGLLWSSGRTLVMAAIGLRIVTAVIPVSMLWISRSIIDGVVEAVKHPGFVPPGIWWLVAAEFVLGAAGSILGRSIDYCDARLADEFSKTVSLRIMKHAATLDVTSFENPTFYDVLERARVQATDRIGMLHAMGSLIQQFITLVSLSAGVIYFSPLLFVILVMCVLPAFLGESHLAFLGYSLAHSLTPIRRELDYLRVLATSKETAKEMKIFRLAGYLQGQFAAATGEVVNRNQRLLRKRAWIGSVLSIIGSLGYYGGYAFLVVRTLQGRLSVGDLTFLAGALAGSNTQLQVIFSTFASIADQALFLTDLNQFFAVQPVIQEKSDGLPAPRPIREGFEFRKVCFHYPQTDRLVIRDLDFRIAPGERVALVGENGQGKTTFVKLISRLYEPTSGQILLDGVDLREYRLEDLHQQIGVIFQDFVRYDLTARENIGVGQIDRLNDESSLLRAAAKSRANELIDRFPDGLQQMLGRRFEGGLDLSGGEWQKFALARAYLRDAQILILDEPTAALDAMAEFEVFRQFTELTEDRMAIMISHRFSTVRMCDRIVVLEGGAIREEGTHGQLVARGGRYATMFELQASNYR